LGRSRPKKNILFWAGPGPEYRAGPDPAQKAGLGRIRPAQIKTGGGGINFPPTSACRTLFVLHAEKKKNVNARTGGKKGLPGAEEAVAGCVSGGAVAEAGGAATVSGGLVRSPRCSFFGLLFWRRLVALRLFPTVSTSLFFFWFAFFSFVFGLVLPLFPFLFSVFSFPSFPSLSFVLPLPLSLLCFFVFSPRLSSVFSLFSFLSLFSSFLCFSSPCSQRSWPLFIEAKDAVFYSSHGGAAGWSAIGRGCRGSVGGARWLVGHCVRSVGSRRESGRQNSKKSFPFSFFPAA